MQKNAQACKKRQKGTAIDKDRESLSKCEIGRRHRAKLPSAPLLTDRAPTPSSDDRKGRGKGGGLDFEKPFCVAYYHPFGNGVRMSTQWKTDTGERPLWAAIYRLFKSSPPFGLSSLPPCSICWGLFLLPPPITKGSPPTATCLRRRRLGIVPPSPLSPSGSGLVRGHRQCINKSL